MFSQSSEEIQVLLITGMGNKYKGHPHQSWTHPYYNEILEETLQGLAKVTITEDLSILNETDLMKYDVIMNNGLFKEPSKEQFEAVVQFIESGKSYFAIHAGLVSFLNIPEYDNVIGGRFIAHDDLKTMQINTFDATYTNWEAPQRPKHSITKGVDDFRTLDELYIMEFNTPDIEVLVRSEGHPVMWMKKQGKGHVLCLALGHFDHSQRNEGFQHLLKNGLKWLANSF